MQSSREGKAIFAGFVFIRFLSGMPVLAVIPSEMCISSQLRKYARLFPSNASTALLACSTCFTGEVSCSVCGLSGVCRGDPERVEVSELDVQCEERRITYV